MHTVAGRGEGLDDALAVAIDPDPHPWWAGRTALPLANVVDTNPTTSVGVGNLTLVNDVQLLDYHGRRIEHKQEPEQEAGTPIHPPRALTSCIGSPW